MKEEKKFVIYMVMAFVPAWILQFRNNMFNLSYATFSIFINYPLRAQSIPSAKFHLFFYIFLCIFEGKLEKISDCVVFACHSDNSGSGPLFFGIA